MHVAGYKSFGDGQVRGGERPSGGAVRGDKPRMWPPQASPSFSAATECRHHGCRHQRKPGALTRGRHFHVIEWSLPSLGNNAPTDVALDDISRLPWAQSSSSWSHAAALAADAMTASLND